jgi:hypothetical protein
VLPREELRMETEHRKVDTINCGQRLPPRVAVAVSHFSLSAWRELIISGHGVCRKIMLL